VSSKPQTVRQAWINLFATFMILQLILVGLGVFFASGGKQLAMDAATRLDSMRSVFQSCSAIGVIACMYLTRAKLTPLAVKTPQDLVRNTIFCLMVGELTVLIALVGLAKLHLIEFLVAAVLVYLVDFFLILPAGLRLLAQPAPKK
jgi:hypothetical protein